MLLLVARQRLAALSVNVCMDRLCSVQRLARSFKTCRVTWTLLLKTVGLAERYTGMQEVLFQKQHRSKSIDSAKQWRSFVVKGKTPLAWWRATSAN